MYYQYTYFLMALVFLVFWLVLFIWRKDTRKEMLVMSVIFSLAGSVANIIYTQDWWRPITLTKTIIGPEDILVGFMIGGIAAVLYEIIFKKKLKIKNQNKANRTKRNFCLFLLLLFSAILFFGCFYVIKLNSLYSTIATFVIPTIIIYIARKDLIVNSLFSGLLLVGVASLVYGALELMTPGWIKTFWYFKNVPDMVLLNVPLDDLIWYFLGGLFIGPLYEFWKGGKIKNY